MSDIFSSFLYEQCSKTFKSIIPNFLILIGILKLMITECSWDLAGVLSLPCLHVGCLPSAHLGSSSEPLGLLIEEPKVGRPQEAIEKAKKNRDVRLSELRAGASAVHLFAQTKHRRIRKSRADVFQPVQAIGPGCRARQPEHSQQGGEHEINLGIVFLLVNVEMVKEHVHSQTEETIKPGKDASEHEELCIRGEVARELEVVQTSPVFLDILQSTHLAIFPGLSVSVQPEWVGDW